MDFKQGNEHQLIYLNVVSTDQIHLFEFSFIVVKFFLKYNITFFKYFKTIYQRSDIQC